MAGFEVVVRPVVFPNIRPAPARSLPPRGRSRQGHLRHPAARAASSSIYRYS